MKKAMIRVSNNSVSARIYISCLFMFFAFVVLLFLLNRREPKIVEILVGGLIILINTILSYKLAFEDYSLYFNKSHHTLLLKKGRQVIQYNIAEVKEFRVEPINRYLTLSFSYYYLIIDGQKFRIRMLSGNNESVTLDSQALVKQRSNLVEKKLRSIFLFGVESQLA